MNNKGFAVSGIIYSILILFLLLLFSILSIMGARKMVLDKLKNDVMNELNDDGDSEVGLIRTPIGEITKELVYDNDTCKTDGSTYQYMGGCYIKGNPNNNYIWYSGFLWRIMGINSDGTIRMIIESALTAIPMGADPWEKPELTKNWDESYAKDWLNNYFYPKLKENNIIVEQIWCSETTTDENSMRTTCTNNLSKEKAKIGLITLDEYNLAGGSSSYLNIEEWYWTITPYDNFFEWSINLFGVGDYAYSKSTANSIYAIINVKFDTIITSGIGILETNWNDKKGPYILYEDKINEQREEIINNVTIGEYVLFAGKKYRVLDKDSKGNVKLILVGYYEEIVGDPYTMTYGTDNTFSTITGIGQKLNTDVLEWLVSSSDIDNRNKLITDYTWYQNEFYYGDDYKISLTEENPARSIQATVGLIRIGEINIGVTNLILSETYLEQYWTMTQWIESNAIWMISPGVYDRRETNRYSLAIRPVIVIKSDVEIIGGTGIWSNPYQI